MERGQRLAFDTQCGHSAPERRHNNPRQREGERREELVTQENVNLLCIFLKISSKGQEKSQFEYNINVCLNRKSRY